MKTERRRIKRTGQEILASCPVRFLSFGRFCSMGYMWSGGLCSVLLDPGRAERTALSGEMSVGWIGMPCGKGDGKFSPLADFAFYMDLSAA